MDYSELVARLRERGYERIERDDRLLDVFPRETREKGVELWEANTDTTVRLCRVRLPYSLQEVQVFELPRPKLQKLLTENIRAELDVFQEIGRGEAAVRRL